MPGIAVARGFPDRRLSVRVPPVRFLNPYGSQSFSWSLKARDWLNEAIPCYESLRQMKRLSWINCFILDLAAAGLAPVPLEELRYGASA